MKIRDKISQPFSDIGLGILYLIFTMPGCGTVLAIVCAVITALVTVHFAK